MLPLQVFVISPFDAEGRQVQETVHRALEEAGLKVLQYDDGIGPGAELTLRILERIRQADLIVADVSRQNPNVFYEIGVADALRKPIILLFDLKSEHRLPSDLTGLQYIPYDVENLHQLADRVKSGTKAFTIRRSA
jgi:nucleoside 2-deoxyribosyltransferase